MMCRSFGPIEDPFRAIDGVVFQTRKPEGKPDLGQPLTTPRSVSVYLVPSFGGLASHL